MTHNEEHPADGIQDLGIPDLGRPVPGWECRAGLSEVELWLQGSQAPKLDGDSFKVTAVLSISQLCRDFKWLSFPARPQYGYGFIVGKKKEFWNGLGGKGP